MGKGGGTNTTTSTSAPPADVMAQYDLLMKQANAQAAQPLQQYQGNIVAPLNALQNQASTEATTAQGEAQPYYNQAQGLIQQGSQELNPNTVTAQDIQNYQNPYTQQVINSTMANVRQQQAGQQSQLEGNAASQGAFGGDRQAVAQALLANQQDLANNQTIAGLENQSYTQALGEANTQQQQQNQAQQASQYLQQQGGFGLTNLGTTAENTALSGAGALNQYGGQQQQVTQEQLNVPYEQFQQRQAFPYQNLSWLSGISTGLGSGMGGTSTTSQPAPNSIFGFNRGGLIKPQHHASGGLVKGYAPGGIIPGQTSFGTSNVPDISIGYIPESTSSPTRGSGIPQAPRPGQQTSGMQDLASGIGLANGVKNLAGPSGMSSLSKMLPNIGGVGGATESISPELAAADPSLIESGAGTSGMFSGIGTALSDAGAAVAPYLPDMLMALFNSGGSVKGYDDGGSVEGTLAPFDYSTNPVMNNATSQYAQLPIAQLQQLATKMHGTPRGQMIQQVLRHKMSMPAAGNMVAEPQMKRGGLIKHYDDGGSASPITDDQATALLPSGLIQSAQPSQNVGTPDANGFTPIPAPTFHEDKPTNEVNPWLSVLAGVAGAAAGRSPYVLQNLAGGVESGLTNYGNQKKEAAEEIYKNGSLQDARDNLVREAQQFNATGAETAKKDRATIENQAAERAQAAENAKNTAAYQQGELGIRKGELAQTTANQSAQRDIQERQLELGKVGFNPITGQSTYLTGEKIGQLVNPSEAGSSAATYADNIGVPLRSYTSKEDAKKAADTISAANNVTAPINDSIMSLQRVKTLLPNIDQGKMAEAQRYIQKAVGAGSTVEDATNQALPAGTPERAAYEELTKLEMNAALQNEVANGIQGRSLGINIVNLGQKMFASPEMSKVAQENIIDKALYGAQMAKNANEVVQPFEGHSSGTLNQVKQQYYNDSIGAGYAIPTKDYLSGTWKKPDYKQTGQQTYSPTGNNAVNKVPSVPPKTLNFSDLPQ